MQKPEATLVAAYGKWKQLSRQVEKRQSGISILAPVQYKTNQVLEVDKPAVDEFGNQLFNADGTEKTETVEKPLTGIAYKKVYVFDVSQTSGKELIYKYYWCIIKQGDLFTLVIFCGIIYLKPIGDNYYAADCCL